MWVVKLGGSLAGYACLQQWLDVLACHGSGNLVLVPGGGRFAEQVREAQRRWRFSDAIAHRMALLAMEQFGWMLLGLRADLVPAASEADLHAALNRAQVPVWLPTEMVLAAGDVPQDWSISADSLAAWLAGRLEADDLVLVKAATVDVGTVSCEALQAQGIVDPALSEFTRGEKFRTWISHREDSELFRLALYGGVVAGSRVSPVPLPTAPLAPSVTKPAADPKTGREPGA